MFLETNGGGMEILHNWSESCCEQTRKAGSGMNGHSWGLACVILDHRGENLLIAVHLRQYYTFLMVSVCVFGNHVSELL